MKDPSKNEGQEASSVASIHDTFSFLFGCTPHAKTIFVAGNTLAVLHGLHYTAFAYILAEAIAETSNAAVDVQPIYRVAKILIVLAAYVFAMAFGQAFCFNYLSRHASVHFRVQWFQSLLRQDVAYYEVQQISSRLGPVLASTANEYADGIGPKWGELIQNLATFVTGLGLAFYQSWETTLVVLGVLPILALSIGYSVRVNQSKFTNQSKAYLSAGKIAKTTLSNMRTMLSLNALPRRIRAYKAATAEAMYAGIQVLCKYSLGQGMIGVSFSVLFGVVTLFGAWELYREIDSSGCDPTGKVPNNASCPTTATEVVAALLALVFAGSSVSLVTGSLEAMAKARVAAALALETMRRHVGSAPAQRVAMIAPKSLDEALTEDEGATRYAELPEYRIDALSTQGLLLDGSTVRGELEFHNVAFRYPTRPQDAVLSDFCCKIPAGATFAVCGPSGSGKSTLVALLERFYDPLEGKVTLDGVDLKDINVKSLREQIGYVGQEPVLFQGTIRENIQNGNPNQETLSLQEIEEAARLANAHDFIQKFPQGYDTLVGAGGSQMSGGQKQRIAIARILLSKPRILILDESTSALDRESEAVVQQALENLVATYKCTTVVIAHRLSTIRNADCIGVMAGGELVEVGSHNELMQSNLGAYRNLVQRQEIGRDSMPTDEDRASSAATQLLETATGMGDINTKNPKDNHSAAEPVQSSKTEKASSVQEQALGPRESGGEREPPSTFSVDETRVAIKFKKVSFSYPSRPTARILRNFSIHINEGESLGLCGPSGGGKSTFLALVNRFYDPDAGAIEYFSHPLTELNVTWYHGQIGYVGQEPNLVGDESIAGNIAYGVDESSAPSLSDIMEAARMANAHDFISKLKNGYDTLVGAEGTELSGGQKQRIAIARALIRKPRVLILDEATSALDSESEALVQKALDEFLAKSPFPVTLIVIAHRLSTIQGMDSIAYIADGAVQERGSHETLMQLDGGRYKALVEAHGGADDLDSSGDSMDRRGESSSLSLTSERQSSLVKSTSEQTKASDNVKEVRSRVWELAKPERKLLVAGAVGALIGGSVYPLQGYLFGQVLQLLFKPIPKCDFGMTVCGAFFESEATSMQDESFQIAGYWAAVAAGAVAGSTIIWSSVGRASERLSKRVRDMVFEALVSQELAVLDLCSIDAVTAQLFSDASRLQAFTGEPIVTLLVAGSSVLIALGIAFGFMWPYALVALLFIPLMGLSRVLYAKSQWGERSVDHEQSDGSLTGSSSTALAVETLTHIKTVSTLTLESFRLQQYQDALTREQKGLIKSSVLSALLAGSENCIARLVNAGQFGWGGYLLHHYSSTFSFEDFVSANYSLVFSLFGVGAALARLSDKAEAEQSALRLFGWVDRKSSIDPLSDDIGLRPPELDLPPHKKEV